MTVKRKRSSYPPSLEVENEISTEEEDSTDGSDFSDSDDNIETIEPDSVPVEAVKSNDDVKQPTKPREVRVLKLGKQPNTTISRNTPRFSPLK